MRKLLKAIIYMILFVGAFTVLGNFYIKYKNRNYIFDDITLVPNIDTAVVLGTSKRIADGRNNLYFDYRIDAAVALYKSGKITHIIVSGDNGHKSYNEPEDMRNALLEKGIPASAITLDYAGFRTLDSVIRAKKVFGAHQYIIISQKFHNERALFIARFHNIDAIAFNAKDVNLNAGLKTQIREYFARDKMFIDLLTGKEPKFY